MRGSEAPVALGLASMSDPEDPTASSGWPASTLAALRGLADRVVAIHDTRETILLRASLIAGAIPALRPAHLGAADTRQRLWTLGRASRPYARARARATAAQARAAGPLDGLVQAGGDYPAPAGLRMVTYQDSTVVQAHRSYPWAHLQGLSPRALASLVERQRSAYASAAACCAFSHWTAESIVRDYGIPSHRVHVIGLGSNHVFAEANHEARDWEVPRFLFVGHDWERKNGELVLRSFAEVRSRFPQATLDLVGGHPPVAAGGVTGHGRLALDVAAERSQLVALYARATAFVMPSVHEPAGAVHVEAQAPGYPRSARATAGPPRASARAAT